MVRQMARPSPRAALLARVGGINLLEAAEDRLKLVGGNSATVIDDGKNDAGDTGPQHDAYGRVGRRKLDGIRQQVGDDLKQAIGIGGDFHLGGVVDELDAGGVGHGLHIFNGLLDDVGQLHIAEAQRLTPALDALQIENVVDEPDQAIGVGEGDAQQVGGLFVGLAQNSGAEQSQRATDGGERRAQLMAHGGDEFIFHPVESVALADIAKTQHGA